MADKSGNNRSIQVTTDFSGNDYRWRLRVLAEIIARVFADKSASNNNGNNDIGEDCPE